MAVLFLVAQQAVAIQADFQAAELVGYLQTTASQKILMVVPFHVEVVICWLLVALVTMASYLMMVQMKIVPEIVMVS